MTPQEPAEGILLQNDWGATKVYEVTCSCGTDDHSHRIWVEADDDRVTVATLTKQETNFWTKVVEPRYDIENEFLQKINWFVTGFINGIATRIRLTKNIWFDGYVTYESFTMLTEQQALNYATVLQTAIKDVAEFKKQKI